MNGFFPSLFHDELLYSGFARYHQRSGNRNCKDTLNELFNNPTSSAISDFPSGLGILCEKIEPSLYQPINLIYNHTLLPYYLPFMNEDQKNRIINQMIEGKSSSIAVSLGLAATKITETNFFRFCAGCYNEEIEQYGEAYWHRTHQLPGVFICPTHKSVLMESPIPYRNKQNKHLFYTLDDSTIKLSKELSILKQYEEQFIYIAEQSYRLLNDSDLLSGMDSFQKFYHLKLHAEGYITNSKRLRLQKLLPAFFTTFEREFLISLNSDFNEDDNDTWFHKVLRKPRVACHPIRHILLLNFLKEDIPNQSELIKYHPFLGGPWPCLNKASDHFKEMIITDCKVSTDSKTRKPVGTFHCKQCNFIYSRKGPDIVEQDRYKIGRIKNFGEVWIKNINELYSQGSSIHKIATILNTDSKTVKKYLTNEKSFIIRTSIELENKKKIIKKAGEEQKSDLLKLIKKHPGFTRTELRRANTSGYMWLYRNERDWLLSVLPNSKTIIRTKRRIDWEERDREYSFLLIKEAINILIEEPLIRVTKTKLAKTLDLQSRFEKYLDKLPVCKTILDDVTETIEDFQIRRIRFYGEKFRKENIHYTKSSLLRSAGLNNRSIESVKFVILDEMNYLEIKN